MSRSKVHIIALTFVLLAFVFACRRPVYSPQLVEADSLCEVNETERALKTLHLLAKDTAQMNDDELFYYHLLTIKASDKSYIPSTSDSLIRRILAHYENGGDERLLPEVYYYAGRVYSDLGDAPQALDYFQKALDLVENDTTNLKLKSVIYSQMGYTAYLCNLYDKALDMHRGCYECGVLSKDTVGMIYGLMDMAVCYESIEKIDSATQLYNKALQLAKITGDVKLENRLHTQISTKLLSEGKKEQALYHIKKSLESVDPNNISVVYSSAAVIYDSLGIIDSSLYYNKQLLKYGEIYARKSAYRWFTSYFMKQKEFDKLLKYNKLYESAIDTIENITATEAVARMNALYNYQIREKQNILLKEKIEKKQRTIILLSIILFVIIISIIYIIMYVRQKRILYKYKLEKYEELLKQYESLPQQERNNKQSELAKTPILSRINFILNAPIRTEKLTEDEWNTLSETINNRYQDFDKKLQDLCKMSRLEYRVCLLLKAGFSQVDIAYLVIKSESAISSIRRRLNEKAFGKVKNAKDWDRFIASL